MYHVRAQLNNKAFILRSLATNALYPADIAYIVEGKNWAIQHVGSQLAKAVNVHSGLRTTVTALPWGLRSRLVHFGSLNTLAWHRAVQRRSPQSRTVLSIFHLVPGKSRNREIVRRTSTLNTIHTSCTITKDQLRALGVPAENIITIPLGIDVSVFSTRAKETREHVRTSLGIPPSALVIGSFQKDGIGWDAGNEPKMEKGPDIFVRALSWLARQYPIHVLLVGPARGYVRSELARRGIPYTHIGYVPKTTDVAPYYAALDAYMISSRIEGGPLGLLESWAAGVPVVTTAVGMAADWAIDGKNSLVADTIDPISLAKHAALVLTDETLSRRLITQARADVQQFDWPRIAELYCRKIYDPLLNP